MNKCVYISTRSIYTAMKMNIWFSNDSVLKQLCPQTNDNMQKRRYSSFEVENLTHS